MFGKSNGNAADTNRDLSSAQEVKRSSVGHLAAPAAPEATSSISSGLSIVGKIVGKGGWRFLVTWREKCTPRLSR